MCCNKSLTDTLPNIQKPFSLDEVHIIFLKLIENVDIPVKSSINSSSAVLVQSNVCARITFSNLFAALSVLINILLRFFSDHNNIITKWSISPTFPFFHNFQMFQIWLNGTCHFLASLEVVVAHVSLLGKVGKFTSGSYQFNKLYRLVLQTWLWNRYGHKTPRINWLTLTKEIMVPQVRLFSYP